MKAAGFILLLLVLAFLNQIEAQKVDESNDIPRKTLNTLDDILKLKNDSFCDTCSQVIDKILSHRRSGANKNSMQALFKYLCYTVTDWGQIVCDGYINIELDTVLYILDNRKNLTAERVCSISFQSRNCQDPNAQDWEVPINSDPPEITPSSAKSESPLRILQLTDFHYDPLYTPGTNADCGLGMCCQESNGPPKDPSTSAGFWGDYHVCDTPWHSITDFMKYLKRTYEKFDYVYYTGDIISHKSWATTKDNNVEAIKTLYKLFADTFKNTKVFPILGNHEPHPTDFYSPGDVASTKVSTQWIFDLANEEWSRWLPEETKSSISEGGYYTVLVKPGFRIIALNSNVCFISNLWLIYDDEDPYGQLKWLVNVLTDAEENGEKVHILSHIPPGNNECMRQWTVQFRKIVTRFAGIISAQFNGHTHLDELRVFYDSNNSSKVINLAFNAGSFTTFVGLNPNYRLYDVDGTTLQVLDYDHYTFNLTEANLRNDSSPEWYKLYSLKEAYGLPDTTYDSFKDLIERMSKDKKLVQQYYRFTVRDSEPQMIKGCDETCLQQQLCSITAVEAQDSINCLLNPPISSK